MSDWCDKMMVFCGSGNCNNCPHENFQKAIDISKDVCYNNCGESQNYFLEGSYEKEMDSEAKVQG